MMNDESVLFEMDGNRIEERYQIEEQLLDSVSRGDYREARRIYLLFREYKFAPRTKDIFRNEQNLMIVLSTMCRKILQYKNHIHPMYLDQASTRIAIQINETGTARELEELPKSILRRYCLLARSYTLKGYTPVVMQAINYITFHFTEDISLAHIAGKCNISKQYLSSIFKKETGLSVTDYLHDIRIKRALFLLNSTDYPMDIVAARCGYHNVNYFIRIFKRLRQQTPKQYSMKLGKKTLH
ncbi:helix-turn-helix transcriptional regulator [Lachnoclostridium sp. Marseille-P6806]|uniref:helix-turn-helix transcriptional regulator n=1 Tax=Lachnoclostridium sp. Marseille-P6806 TaxID=2364793 RepID=UPI00102F36DA|nr:AraC family transcriptional regulator [Lachnoclostridium sp. Marseille-P6806]